MARLIFALCLAAGSASAFAQHRQQGQDGSDRMSPQERQRLRDDMHSARRDVYRDNRPQPPLPPAGGRMSEEEREKLRRDVIDANRGLPRR
ncbi:MAG: hypothetical protein EXR31_00750 [Betaproteobacteria bacterium]|nr:hypothetical protein [Betaproteobacteria bacterium]